MAKLNKTTEIVKTILLENEAARSDDFILILEVFKTFGIKEDDEIGDVFKVHKEKALPSIHSILRVRRFIQSKHPELVDQKAIKQRKEEEKIYKKWAREKRAI